jgi:CheY-like chemotaxis protein
MIVSPFGHNARGDSANARVENARFGADVETVTKPIFMLFAEDDPDDVMLLEHALSRLGIKNFYIARDGVEVVEYLQGLGKFKDKMRFPTPTCLILDVNMPRMNGVEVCEWLKKHEDQCIIPTVLFTGAATEDDLRRAYLLGVRTVFRKPSDLDCLLKSLRLLQEYWSQAEIPETQLNYACA